MSDLLLGSASALWLGILTSISPCPLATNIAAISFIGRRVGHSRLVFLTGLLYTLGRTLVYLVLGVILTASVLSAPQVSAFLMKYMNKILGPILILLGMVLLGLITFSASGRGVSEKLQRRAETLGIWGGGLLGVIFALSFCPMSAALFFGSLITLAVKYQSSIMLPSFYGIGTALPVIVFAVAIAVGAQSLGRMFQKLTQFEKWARTVTGIVFIAIGIYFCLQNIFKLF